MVIHTDNLIRWIFYENQRVFIEELFEKTQYDIEDDKIPINTHKYSVSGLFGQFVSQKLTFKRASNIIIF